jgi:hypothetical protein
MRLIWQEPRFNPTLANRTMYVTVLFQRNALDDFHQIGEVHVIIFEFFYAQLKTIFSAIALWLHHRDWRTSWDLVDHTQEWTPDSFAPETARRRSWTERRRNISCHGNKNCWKIPVRWDPPRTATPENGHISIAENICHVNKKSVAPNIIHRVLLLIQNLRICVWYPNQLKIYKKSYVWVPLYK